MGPTASLETLGAKSFEDAIEKRIARADKTLKNVEGARITEQKVIVTDVNPRPALTRWQHLRPPA